MDETGEVAKRNSPPRGMGLSCPDSLEGALGEVKEAERSLRSGCLSQTTGLLHQSPL